MNAMTAKSLLTITICVLFSITARAQGGGSDKTAQTFYLEGGGPGMISLNYDQRFKGQNGFGFRVGMGGWGILNKGVFAAPVGVNYITGSQEHFAEIGAGLVYTSASVGNTYFENEGSNVSAYFNFGYRYQPPNKGITYRAFLCPLLTPAKLIPFYAGASVGLKF